ncbi:MAG: hypothetical protein ACYDH1_00730 [Anaerolineaceae bacterium]
MAGPVAGKSPIFVTSVGEMKWTDMVVSLQPFPGRLTKILIFVQSDVDGDLEITGRQIDGNGIVLFYQEGQGKFDNNGELVGSIISSPKDKWIFPSANQPSRYPNPEGFVHHGLAVYYPNPGCYEYIFTIADREVRVVMNIIDSEH